jgi:hypothetical protein
MEVFDQGTLAGAGTFRCEACGFPVALQGLDALPPCPRCHAGRFQRSSLWEEMGQAEPIAVAEADRPGWLDGLRDELVRAVDHLAYEDASGVHAKPLDAELTRIGRSPMADVRLDDPTVSRRHALVHRHGGAWHILDDRSLNGVWVHGERVEDRPLTDGDAIGIGSFVLFFLAAARSGAAGRVASTAGRF